jgi:hypothetical protein
MPLCRRAPLFAALPALIVFAVGAARADDEALPSFKNVDKRETEDFVTKVGAAVIKAARTKPQKIELKKHEYTTPKAGRKDLVLKMTYSGLVTKKKYDVDITVMLTVDPSDKDKWEVVNIKYKDTNPSPLAPSEKKIQALIKEFNK